MRAMIFEEIMHRLPEVKTLNACTLQTYESYCY